MARQLALVQFLTSLNDLNLGLFSDMILKGMLNLIVTIIRMHCSSQSIDNMQPEFSLNKALVQNRSLGIRASGLLLKMLTSDDRTLNMLNPDRIMLLNFNLGSLIESTEPSEKELGLTLSMFFLHHHA